MAIPKTIEGREYVKFVPSPTRANTDTAVEVVVGNTPLPVEFQEDGNYLNQFSELNSVAGLATATIVNYTVPIGKELRLKQIDYSGQNIGVYEVEVNASVESRKRTYYTDYNGKFEFEDYVLSAGDNLKLIVENKNNSTADFNANLQGRLLDA